MIATSVCSISSFACPTLLTNFAFDSYFERNIDAVEQVTHLDLAGVGTMGAISMIALYFCTSIPLRIYSHEKEYVPFESVHFQISIISDCLLLFYVLLQIYRNFTELYTIHEEEVSLQKRRCSKQRNERKDTKSVGENS